MCQTELTEFFAELIEFAAELSEFSLPKQPLSAQCTRGYRQVVGRSSAESQALELFGKMWWQWWRMLSLVKVWADHSSDVWNSTVAGKRQSAGMIAKRQRPAEVQPSPGSRIVRTSLGTAAGWSGS